jgi:hypothetical protein
MSQKGRRLINGALKGRSVLVVLHAESGNGMECPLDMGWKNW